MLGFVVGFGFGFLGGAMIGANVTGTSVPWWTDIPLDPPTSSVPHPGAITPVPISSPPVATPPPTIPDNQTPIFLPMP